MRERQKVVSLASMKEHSLLQFYISREWLNKFNTFAEPGPITNHTFLCAHGGEAGSGNRSSQKLQLQRDPLPWQNLQPAQGGMRQSPLVLLVRGLEGSVVLGNNSFQFSVCF